MNRKHILLINSTPAYHHRRDSLIPSFALWNKGFWIPHLASQLLRFPPEGQYPKTPSSKNQKGLCSWLKQDYIRETFFFSIFISWRLITLQYCSGFCHTLTWISHGFTCIPHPISPSHLPLYRIPLGLPSAPSPSTCIMHPTWADYLFHPR